MPISIPDRYINLLTDFGFKRVFGFESNNLRSNPSIHYIPSIIKSES
ncbi:MAG: hypothetical protein F6J87_30845 [Spirulina sp. SIO3F2]|nr:hypothetical protein [Spirulina sp. SIO3F2]